jgi:hypothetical protein
MKDPFTVNEGGSKDRTCKNNNLLPNNKTHRRGKMRTKGYEIVKRKRIILTSKTFFTR